VIGSFLDWKVGNGLQFRVGVDVIMGCDRRILLSKDLIYYFQMIRKTTLNSMSNPSITTIG
jgi:hypothetical protein